MKIAIAAAFLAVGICLLLCMIKTGGNDRKIACIVRRLLFTGVLAVSANIVIVRGEEVRLCAAAYSVFFVCLDWLLYYIFLFVVEFVGVDEKRYVKKPFFYTVLVLDTLSMLGNNFFGHAFECVEVFDEGGNLYFKPVGLSFYHAHLVLAYILVCGTLGILVYRILKPSGAYRKKYLLMLLIFAFIVVGDAVYVFTNAVVNVSIIFYGLGGVMIYYYALVFVPRELLKRTMTMVIQDLKDAIFILDEKGECIHANDSALSFLEEEKLDLDAMEGELAGWQETYGKGGETNFSFNMTRQRAGEKIHYKVYYHKLLDEKQCYLGSFFTIEDRTEEINSLEQERYAAAHDVLTGLYNRRYFYKKVEKTLTANPEEEYLIICSDIRNFKLVNDVFGAERGDELLQRIADVLRQLTREDEVYARLESDHFGLLMKKKDYREDVFVKIPKKIAHMEGDLTYPIQVCIGVYEIADKTLPVSVMCDRAFMAVNTIKGKYGKEIAYYDDELRDKILREQELVGELSEAISTGQFQIFLQPQMDGRECVLGAEALVRWKHPVKGMISPGEFIPVFEKNGLIVQLDRYVWELACIQLKKWKEQGREDLYLSVNISPKDFYFMDVQKTFLGLVNKYKIHPSRLKLEITETAVMHDFRSQVKLIKNLREAGFVVEMDDFGSGYSSLNMLKDIQVDVLKIDMAFLGKTEDEVRARKILKIMVELSRQLEIPVITEGVETADQVEFLKGIGCDMFQGYFFARPMEVSAFEEKYM